MNRILLADDSPHAQRMGERILRDEGYHVVSVTDGETALLRMADVDPDVVVADVYLPGRSGLDLCAYVRTEPAHSHTRMVLTAGMLEPFDEEQALAAGADAIIKKPFEASVVADVVRPLVAKAVAAKVPRAAAEPAPPAPAPHPVVEHAVEPEPEHDPIPAGTGVSEEELLRAAVAVALDAAFPALVDDITARILANLRGAHSSPADAIRHDLALPIPAAHAERS